MKQYLDTLNLLLDSGEEISDRTGTGTKSIIDVNLKFDLNKGFPILTTKKIHFKSIVHELLWFLKGDTNIKYLKDNKISIWDEWADETGELGPTYGSQWRNYNGEGIDQITDLVKNIKKDPYSRRHILLSWNPAKLKQMRLPPCHVMAQFFVRQNKLSCKMIQRSCDFFLGGGFNFCQYSLLTHMIAHVTGLQVDCFYHSIGDCHLYLNHIEQAKLQLTREPKPLPILWLNPEVKELLDFKYEDIKLIGYESHPSIKAPVAI